MRGGSLTRALATRHRPGGYTPLATRSVIRTVCLSTTPRCGRGGGHHRGSPAGGGRHGPLGGRFAPAGGPLRPRWGAASSPALSRVDSAARGTVPGARTPPPEGLSPAPELRPPRRRGWNSPRAGLSPALEHRPPHRRGGNELRTRNQRPPVIYHRPAGSQSLSLLTGRVSGEVQEGFGERST